MSLVAVGDVLKYGAVCQPRTMIEGAYQLEPGHVMIVNIDNLQFNKSLYYDLVVESKKRKKQNSYEEAVLAVRKELEIATRYHMVADVEVGAFLSGGVDSTAAVALMQQYSSKPVSTFTIGFSKDEGVVDETGLAEHTASLLGTKHQTIKVNDQYIDGIFDEFIEGLDQPSIDGINTFIVSRETSKSVKVAISGLGGDEIFAGYSHFLTLPKYVQGGLSMIGRLIRALHNIRPNRVTRKYAYRGLPIEQALNMQRTLWGTGKLFYRQEAKSRLDVIDEGLTAIQRISKAEIEGYMLNTLLRDSDALSMSNSLELRPILLDHNLFELAFGLDDEFKVRNGRFKSVFADAVKDLIPEGVIERRKTGFEMPFISWMNGILNDRFATVLQQPITKEIFDARYLRNLTSRVSTRRLKRNDWPAFILLSWIEKYGVYL
jgi:asparagine synthase (glutamine-hydrolysing)